MTSETWLVVGIMIGVLAYCAIIWLYETFWAADPYESIQPHPEAECDECHRIVCLECNDGHRMDCGVARNGD